MDTREEYLREYEKTTDDFSDCVLCKHKSVDWDEEPCKSCGEGDNHYEPIKEKR